MSTGPVCMAMRNLIRCSISKIDDRDLKGQSLTCQRVVGVDVDVKLSRFYYRCTANPIFGVDLDRHAGANSFWCIRQMLDGYALNTSFDSLAVGVFRLKCDFKFVSRCFSLERLFERWHNVSVSVQVKRRLRI